MAIIRILIMSITLPRLRVASWMYHTLSACAIGKRLQPCTFGSGNSLDDFIGSSSSPILTLFCYRRPVSSGFRSLGFSYSGLELNSNYYHYHLYSKKKKRKKKVILFVIMVITAATIIYLLHDLISGPSDKRSGL